MTARPSSTTAFRSALTLRKGRNVIRAAIINGGGATDFCARFLDENDQPIQGLTASVQSLNESN